MKHFLRLSFSLLVSAIGPCMLAQQPGDLDSDFGVEGKVVLDGFQPDGVSPNILVVSTSEQSLYVAFNELLNYERVTRVIRLYENGGFDSSFAEQGLLTSTRIENLLGIHLTTDEKIILVGFANISGTKIVYVERYHGDGLIDINYGTNGFTELGLDGSLALVAGSLIMPDDRLLIHGNNIMLRLDHQGGDDSEFGVNGVREIVNGPSRAAAIALAPSGRLRWVRSQCYEIDYNGQDDVETLQGPGAIIFDPICIDMFDRTILVAHNTVSGVPGSPTTNGVFRGASMAMASSSNLGLHGSYYILGGTSQYGHMSTQSGHHLFAADQQGNLIVAYKIVHQTGVDSLPWAWTMRRVRSIENVWDGEFGTDEGQPWFGVMTDFEGYNPFQRSMVIQDDGKIVVAGWGQGDEGRSILLARYLNIADARCRLGIRVMLGGAYDPLTGLMRDDLRLGGWLPTFQPYAALGVMGANGVGQVAMPAARLEITGSEAPVDWVWVELLDAAMPGVMRASRLGVLQRNGWVSAPDGKPFLDFGVGEGEYLVRIKHRNHLSVTSQNGISLGSHVVNVDFTDTSLHTFGEEAQMLLDGLHMMWPGDVNRDHQVKYTGNDNDRDKILMLIGGVEPTMTTSGYHLEDVNLDGIVKYTGANNDRDPILMTIGGSWPNSVRVEQGP